jgi:hypothetical protein
MNGAAARTAAATPPDRELPIEPGDVRRRIADPTRDEDTGTVDEDVEPAEALDDRLDQTFDLAGIGLVGLERRRSYAVAFKRVDHRLGLVGRRYVAHRDVRTLRRKALRDRRAYPARSAGDQRHLTC